MRQGAVWIPDWPVTAAELAGDIAPGTPAAVVGARGVIAANAWARARGVRANMPRRSIHHACPEAVILAQNRERDAAHFEPVLRAIDHHVAQVTVFEVGSVLFSVRPAARAAGSTQALVEALIGDIAEIADCEAHVGIAEGTLAALLAARSDLMLEAGQSQDFLREQPIDVIGLATGPSTRPHVEQCLDLLKSLGVGTLGQAADLGAACLANRFGRVGHVVWSLASGCDVALAPRQEPFSGLAFSRVFEPPAEGVEEAVFAVRSLAEEMSSAMHERTLSGGRLTIGVSTQEGMEAERSWSLDVGGARDILDRVRWQLSSWVDGPQEIGALARLELRLEQAVAAEHEPLWGRDRSGKERALRSVARLQALVGDEAVRVPRKVGGRSISERHVEAAWGELLGQTSRAELPWPGGVPEPEPALVHPAALPAALVGSCEHELGVTGEGLLTCARRCGDCAPALLHLPGESVSVLDYAGPWPVAERWWDSTRRRRRAYVQIAHAGGARLIYCEEGAWHEEARYG